MKHLESIYRNYDIRGEYPNEIHEEEIYKIGATLVKHYNLQTIAVGRDIRPSADSLFAAFSKGVNEQGGDVIDLGLTTSPMCFFSLRLGVDAAVMITASHMPSKFSGLKIYTKGHIPMYGNKLKEVEKYVQEGKFEKTKQVGSIEKADIRSEWNKFFSEHFDFKNNNFSVVVDPANMIGILEIETLRQFEPGLAVHSIFDEFDHTCPNHEANPIKLETLDDLRKKVVETNSDIGIGFDGDADRVGFVDEEGNHISSDIIGAIIANHMIATGKGGDVVHDITCTRALPKFVEKIGGTASVAAVGYTNVTKIMRDNNSDFGIELSGHFFFKEVGSVEGGVLPFLYVLSEMKRQGKKLSELVEEIPVPCRSGQINSTITLSIEEIYERLQEKYNDGEITTLDGLKVDYDKWWFIARPSANDPVMRLNIEADTEELMKEKTEEILEIIRAEN